jgi:hypothetical protein
MDWIEARRNMSQAALDFYPGKIFKAWVESVRWASGQGCFKPADFARQSGNR